MFTLPVNVGEKVVPMYFDGAIGNKCGDPSCAVCRRATGGVEVITQKIRAMKEGKKGSDARRGNSPQMGKGRA